MAPAVLIIVGVVFIPIINAILMSFQNYDLRRPKEIGFIGLGNYLFMLKDPLFWGALWRTFLWVFFGVGLQFVFGFLLANLLNKNFFGRGAIRAVSMIPWVTPGVLIGLMWRWIYDGNFGVLNDLLLKFGTDTGCHSFSVSDFNIPGLCHCHNYLAGNTLFCSDASGCSSGCSG